MRKVFCILSSSFLKDPASQFMYQETSDFYERKIEEAMTYGNLKSF